MVGRRLPRTVEPVSDDASDRTFAPFPLGWIGHQGKKALGNEILREAVERVSAPKKLPQRVSSWWEVGW